MTQGVFDRPREKLRQRGVVNLSSSELLQLLIGSGNAQMGVSKIARKTLRALEKYGSDITYEQLEVLPGLGPARISQILASFELASRYPSTSRLSVIDTPEKVVSLFKTLRTGSDEQLAYVTLDGASREIVRRFLHLSRSHPTATLRQIFADIVRDNASRLIVGIGCRDRSLEPTLFDLAFVRDLRAMAVLFHVTVRSVYLVNQTSERPLKVTP